MRSLVLASTTALTIATGASGAELWVGFDLSDSSPLLNEDTVALSAGTMVATAVRSMQRGDAVMLRSFGEAGVSEQQINITINLTGQQRPDRIAAELETLIASLPERARQGQLQLEGRTNLMGWLERVGPTLNCNATPTKVIVLTDGIEWSDAIQGHDLLQGAPLPAPSGAILEGCEVEFWGVGQQQRALGMDDRWYPILRATWTAYMEEAGVASFHAFASYSR